ncbi:MAG: hypothetical protein AB7F75_10055 [Planctomycetota bacterium]
MKQHLTVISLAMLLLFTGCDSEEARQRDVIRDLVGRLDVNDWRARREIRRQIQGQGAVAVPVLWESCDTDSIEELRQLITMLRNLDGWSSTRWNARRRKIRQRHLAELDGTPTKVHDSLEVLSLHGIVEDAEELCTLYTRGEQDIGEKAYATSLRLGLPSLEDTDPVTRSRKHREWLKEHPRADRENLLWASLPRASSASDRQRIFEGLIGAVTTDPDRERTKAQDVWTLIEGESDEAIRNSGLLLLGCLGDRRFVPQILDKGWLSSSDFRTRTAVSWALNEMGFDNPQPRP